MSEQTPDAVAVDEAQATPVADEAAPSPAPSTVAERRAARAQGTGKAARDARYKLKKAAEKKGATPATPASATPAAPPPRPELDRRRDLAVFVRFAWRVCNAVAFLIGYQLEALTDAEIDDQAATLLPLTVKYPAFDRTVSVVAAPFNLLDLLARKLHKRAPAASSRGDGDGRVVQLRGAPSSS